MTGEQMKYITGSFLSVWAAILVVGLLLSAYLSFGIVTFGKYPWIVVMRIFVAGVGFLSVILFFTTMVGLRRDSDRILNMSLFMACCTCALCTYLFLLIYNIWFAAVYCLMIAYGILYSIKIKVEIEERMQK